MHHFQFHIFSFSAWSLIISKISSLDSSEIKEKYNKRFYSIYIKFNLKKFKYGFKLQNLNFYPMYKVSTKYHVYFFRRNR